MTNSGQVFLLSRFFPTSKDFSKNTDLKKTNALSTTKSLRIEDNYEHRIVAFKDNTTQYWAIPNTDKFYTTLDISANAQGDLILMGFYSPLGSTHPSGATFLKVNTKSGMITEVSTKDFGNQFERPSDISNKRNGLVAGEDQYLDYRFVLSDIHFNQNGGYTLIGERTVTQRKKDRSAGGVTYYTVYNTDDLAIIDANAKGLIKDVHKIDKGQQTSGLQVFYSGYFFTEKHNTKYFAFANLGKDWKTETVLVAISPDGKQSKSTLFSAVDSQVTIHPGGSTNLSKDELMLYSQKNNRKVRFIKVGLK